MPIIDSQVHAYEANTPKRPWHTVPNWPPHVTGDEMVAAMDGVGVDGAIFISAFSMYRYDASYAVEVQRSHPGRFALVKPVDPEDPVQARMVRRPIGVRRQHDANPDRARCHFPFGDHVGHRGIVRIDRLDDGKAPWMRALHLDCVARVVAV